MVNDQFGRLTFTSELARAIRHLIATRAPYGTYNVTGAGSVTSWADVARQTFALAGHDPDRVTGVSTAEYFATPQALLRRGPASSVLDLAKIQSTGFGLADAGDTLREYLR